MSTQPLEEEQGTGRGKRTEASACPARPSLDPKSTKDKGYRKKRLIALILATLVCLSVPTLITLLVLFG